MDEVGKEPEAKNNDRRKRKEKPKFTVMNRLLALIALPFILCVNLLTDSGKRKRSNRDGLDLLSHSFEIGERIEKHPPSLIGEPKF